MGSVLDAEQEALTLIHRYGYLALGWAHEREREAAANGDEPMVGYWEVIALNIRFLEAVRDCEQIVSNQVEIRMIK